MNTAELDTYKTALVTLDLSEMDDHLIRYTAMISEILPLERVFFVHVAKKLELPQEVVQAYPDLFAPLDESIENTIQKEVDRYFSSSDLEVKCIVSEGNAIEEILRISRIKSPDLILMGRKQNLKGSGLVTSHIARKAPCSLLLVTENFGPSISKVLIPVDFSDHSGIATEQAMSLAGRAKAEVTLLHVYNVPTGYYKTGKTYEEFADIMKGHAKEACRRFLSSKEILADQVTCEFLLEDEQLEKKIFGYATDIAADLIFVGSKGRTNASAVIMGSFAEKLAFQDRSIPMFIVKRKGENMGLLETLMKI